MNNTMLSALSFTAFPLCILLVVLGLNTGVIDSSKKPTKKTIPEKVDAKTFNEISIRLDKIDSLYLEIDSLIANK